MIGGYGQSVILKSLMSKSFNNSKIDLDGIAVFSSERKNCDCCTIY